MNNNTKEAISRITSIPLWDHPGKYLGILAKWGGSKVQGLSWLKDKVLGKLEGWKGNLLNPARKEIMIRAVVQAVPNYIMAILQLPKTLCDSLTVAVAKFWWQSSGKHRGIHWRKFEELCSPKALGGLGFKDFKQMNTAFLTKHV